MILRFIGLTTLLISMIACSDQQEDTTKAKALKDTSNKLSRITDISQELTEDGIYILVGEYNNMLVDRSTLDRKNKILTKLNEVVQLGDDVLVYYNNHADSSSNKEFIRIIQNSVNNAKNYIRDFNNGVIKDLIAKREKDLKDLNNLAKQTLINSENMAQLAQEVSIELKELIKKAADEKVKRAQASLQDIESDFRELHQFYEPESVGFIRADKIESQVGILSYQDQVKAKQGLPDIVARVQHLRQQFAGISTYSSDYDNSLYLIKMIGLKSDLNTLERIINRFEQKLNQSLWKQERASVQSESSAA